MMIRSLMLTLTLIVPAAAGSPKSNTAAANTNLGGAPRICAVNGSSRLVAVRGACPDGSSRTRVAAVNIFDAMYDGSTAMGSPDPRAPNKDGISIANTTAALASAAANNIRVFRMFSCLWGPHMSFWVTNETQYWVEFDAVMDEIERYPGLHVIPSIGYSQWWWVANEAFAGVNETMNDFILNGSSVGRGLANTYFEQIVSRYAKRDCVLLWELGNELNLQVNLPPPKCGDPTAKCFGTAAMTKFTAEIVGIIRGIDPRRPISSGMGTPLPCAWHNARCDWKTNTCPPGVTGGFWGIDSKEQWLDTLAEQQAGTDYWSIHLYDNSHGAGVDNGCYFKSFPNETCAPLTDVIAAASAAASSAGRGLYLGEYGGPPPNFTGPTMADQAYPSAALALQVAQAKAAPNASAFDLSTIWAFMGAWTRIAPWNMVFIFPDSNIPIESGSKAMLDVILRADAALAKPSTMKGIFGAAL